MVCIYSLREKGLSLFCFLLLLMPYGQGFTTSSAAQKNYIISADEKKKG